MMPPANKYICEKCSPVVEFDSLQKKYSHDKNYHSPSIQINLSECEIELLILYNFLLNKNKNRKENSLIHFSFMYLHR